MTSLSIRLGLALCCAGLFFPGTAPEAAQTGVFVEVKESDAPDARVIEHWKLYGSSYALVIGINEYSGNWPRLSKAIEDAREVGKALEARGFEVTLKTNLTSIELIQELRKFYAIKGADPDARLVVWFAGHGFSRNGEGYLVPSDAGSPSKPEFLTKAFSMRDFGSLVRSARAKHAMAIFDSCFAGSIFNVQRSRPPAAITEATKKPVRQFLTSGDANQQVADDGTFRRLFIDALNGEELADGNRDGYLTGTELSVYLENRVTNLTQGQQTPRRGKLRDPDFDRGDFVFLLPKKLAALAKAVDQETRSDRELTSTGPSEADLDFALWDAIKDSKDPQDYLDYAQAHPNGHFASIARRRAQIFQAAQKSEAEAETEAEQQHAALPPAEDLTPEFEIQEMEAPYRVTTRANVRAGPATQFERVDTLASGQEVIVTGKVKGANWFRIAFGEGDQGFIFGQLIQDEASYQAETLRKAAAAVASSTESAASTPSEAQVATRSDPRKPGMIGSWRGCDGRVVRFAQEADRIVGRYAALGNLAQFKFELDEIGYWAQQQPDGRFVGQVKWRWTDGRWKWVSNTTTINGNQYSDTGSDPCSNRMKRQ